MNTRSRLTIALTVLILCGCGDKPPTATLSDTPTPVPITTAPIEARTVQRGVSVVGTLAGSEELFLAPKVDGRVVAIRADVGDAVLPGAILLELDPTDLQLEVEASRRALEAELARLGLSAIPAGDFDADRVASVRKAAAGLTNAQNESTRIKSLGNSGVSQREFDAADFALKDADATYRDALTQARATLASARLRDANLRLAQQRLRDATLIAPTPTGQPAWAGLVGNAASPMRYAVAARLVSEGEMIRANPITNAFRLVLDYALKLRAAVPEQYAADIRIGQPVELKVDAYPERVFQGVVARVNPTVDPTTRTFLAEVSVPNLDSHLKAGGFTRGTIRTRADANVLTVPAGALVTFAGVVKVFVIEAGHARAVEVTTGARDREWVEVRGPGLNAGQSVAMSGFSKLVDGSAVVGR